MDIIPFYQSGNQVLLALDADITVLPVKDNLVVMLNLKKGIIEMDPYSVQRVLKYGYWDGIDPKEYDSLRKRIIDIFGKEQIAKIIEMLVHPSEKAIQSLIWIPERLKKPQAKVVKLDTWVKGKESYNEALKETIAELKAMESTLYDLMVSLAMAGKWKAWSDSKPVGTEFTFTEKMLKDTGDKNVDALAAVMDELIRIRRIIAE